jgi:TPR repeat protein
MSRYAGQRKSSGVNPFPQYDATASQTSSAATSERGDTSAPSGEVTQSSTPDTGSLDSVLPPTHTVSIRSRKPITQSAQSIPIAHQAPVLHVETHAADDIGSDFGGEPGPIIEESFETLPQLRYPPQQQPYPTMRVSSQQSIESIGRPKSTNTIGSSSNSDGANRLSHRQHLSIGNGSPSPSASPMLQPQGYPHRYSPHSPENRPQSYIDLLQTPYAQQVAPAPNLDNSFLRQNVGTNASLLEASKTLELYRANAKKTNDSAIQYEFAVFMVQMALDLPVDALGPPSRAELLRDARQLLQKLADKSYPFAQYYLADGYGSGLFNKGKEDYDRAFPLFIAAAKRGHAEAAYRAALCYEFGWGCRKDYQKAAQYYRMSASKNHPGAATRLGLACINEGMGLSGKYREGVKWLKRAAESADTQYNAAPYELAKLHENGFGDDIFKDEEYAAQLFTQSANLGHADANLVMGKAYEHGLLGCPQDAALSIHFYTGAAEAGEPEAMMALCAWYLFGAEPILEKNENEAFAWAVKAAELSMCRRSKDPL